VAGITEMLIQSHDGFVELLPALPTCWKNGSFRGLCARGGFVFSAQWSDRALTSLSVESRLGGSVTLKIGGKEYKLNTNKGEKLTLTI
jgi:alpha-L-fucosidase 2